MARRLLVSAKTLSTTTTRATNKTQTLLLQWNWSIIALTSPWSRCPQNASNSKMNALSDVSATNDTSTLLNSLGTIVRDNILYSLRPTFIQRRFRQPTETWRRSNEISLGELTPPTRMEGSWKSKKCVGKAFKHKYDIPS